MNAIFARRSTYIYVASQILKFSTLPQLTPSEINKILRENEHTQLFTDGPIKGYDSNQLRSNKPIEDSRTEATIVNNKGFLCGIYDGHAGPSCSQVISKRLLRYLAATLTDITILKKEIANGANSQSFLKCHNDKVDFVKEIRDIYEDSFQSFVKDFLSHKKNLEVSQIMENAFVRLDDDLSKEALEHKNVQTLSVAMSGAVAVVAYVNDHDLFVASTGDCAAVMGTLSSDTGQWITKTLTTEHNAENLNEVKRILDEHPPNEKETVIRNDRLLGQLAPLRALGDFRYKWSIEIMQSVVVPLLGPNSVPYHYNTPPYLTARPDITHHKLTKNDRFLVIASDGLWDFLTPNQVVALVGEHIVGKEFVEPIEIRAENDVTFGSVLETLSKRKAGRANITMDRNCATHLIRNALGGTENGVEHSKLSYLLTLPQDVVRQYRDDITITVIYFNTEYFKKN